MMIFLNSILVFIYSCMFRPTMKTGE